jgi:hypothetical protein
MAMRNAPRQLQRTRLQYHAAPVRLCEPPAASALLEQQQRQQQVEDTEEDGQDEGAAMDAHDEETFDDNDFYTQVCATSLYLLYCLPSTLQREYTSEPQQAPAFIPTCQLQHPSPACERVHSSSAFWSMDGALPRSF